MSKSQLTNWRLKICQAPFPIFAPWRRKAHTFPWISGMKLEYSLFITCEVRQIGTLAPIYLWLPYPCSLVQNSFKRRKNASFQVKNSKKNFAAPLHPPRSQPGQSSGRRGFPSWGKSGLSKMLQVSLKFEFWSQWLQDPSHLKQLSQVWPLIYIAVILFVLTVLNQEQVY